MIRWKCTDVVNKYVTGSCSIWAWNQVNGLVLSAESADDPCLTRFLVQHRQDWIHIQHGCRWSKSQSTGIFHSNSVLVAFQAAVRSNTSIENIPPKIIFVWINFI